VKFVLCNEANAGLIVIWAVLGPIFHFSDNWQLVINTGTTIVTFLMVFLIQNTQNRDARAINLKLNELIRAIDKARDQMIDIENLSDLELDELQAKYERSKQNAKAAQRGVVSRKPATSMIEAGRTAKCRTAVLMGDE
jgi:low affinity Fe/Cu permease